MTGPIHRGMVFKSPHGRIEVSAGMVDEHTVKDGHGNQHYVESCRRIDSADELKGDVDVLHNGTVNELRAAGRMVPGFVLADVTVTPWGRSAQVLLPCCLKARRGAGHMTAMKCPECKGWWRLFLGAKPKLVWLGSKRPFDYMK